MPATPLIVHKVHDNSDGVDGGDGFSDLQIDAIAMALAGLRAEIRDETQAAIATAVAELRDENDLTETVARAPRPGWRLAEPHWRQQQRQRREATRSV